MVQVAKGWKNKEIAAILDLSPETVGTYLRRIYAKLGVHCRAATVTELFRRHLHLAAQRQSALRAEHRSASLRREQVSRVG